ncbi:uncharacterized mitochondrial protein AtMg00810-like [Lactuca sativa]|uniref:uncharacterized mitochondrial protein AtMg00810-like n=1 Tax=Lactuca sativa TaxID=4236 RepID=UPI000CD8254A|nr:uncharacterized mitochondrial protein AtMg00810-like [Lactuca sativa]
MDICASTKVPMGFGHKIFADPSGAPVDEKKYRGMIGSLLYLTSSCPDIMYQESRNLYPANESFLLQAYSNSNYGGLQLDRKSTSGGYQFLGGLLVSWSSKKQNYIAHSTAKAEYIATTSCTSQVLCMKSQLLD